MWKPQNRQKKLKIHWWCNKIHNYDSVCFGPLVHTHTAGLNYYFDLRIKKFPIPKPNIEIVNMKYIDASKKVVVAKQKCDCPRQICGLD